MGFLGLPGRPGALTLAQRQAFQGLPLRVLPSRPREPLEARGHRLLRQSEGRHKAGS
jgi:hypothetical protein